MSLSDWLKAHWLTEHKTSRQEIADLLAVVDRDLKASTVKGLDDDWRLAIAYNAALQCATAALAAATAHGIEDAATWLLEAYGVLYHNKLLHIDSVIIDHFAGSEYLYHILASE